MIKEIIRYLKTSRELGQYYKKTSNEHWQELSEYELKVVENLKGTMIGILDMGEPMYYFNWKNYLDLDWVKISENSIILSTGSGGAYYKEKGKPFHKINGLNDYIYYGKVEATLIFKRRMNVESYKALSVKELKVFTIEGYNLRILKNIGYIQTYEKGVRVYPRKNGEIDSNFYWFLFGLPDEEGYQINLDRKLDRWGLYYISKEGIELIDTYDECELVEGYCCEPYPKTYMVQKDGVTMLVEVNQNAINTEM